MADMKRINGSGKKVYNWNDAPSRSARSMPRTVKSYQPVRPVKGQAKWLSYLAGAVLLLALILGFQTANDLARTKAKLNELKRAQNSLMEQIDSRQLTLTAETKDKVIRQLARERLYMVDNDEKLVSLYLPQHSGTQLASN